MTESEVLASIVSTAIKAVTGPLLAQLSEQAARIAAIDARIEQMDAKTSGELRKVWNDAQFPKTWERLAALEQKAAIPGPTGPAGPQGAPGPCGDCGPMGAKGDPGECGPMGPQGEAGTPGPRGETGPMGPVGEKGLSGERGLDGAAGRDGVDGSAGLDGARGEKGDPGERGVIDVETLAALRHDIDQAKALSVRDDLSADSLATEFAELLRQGLGEMSAPVIQKRVVRDAQGRIERVVEEPVAP